MSTRETNSKALTEAQKRRFVRNGFVVIEDAVSESVRKRARESFWDSLPDAVDRNDPSTWNEAAYEDGLDMRPEPADREAHEDLLREVYPYAESLVGEALAPPEDPPEGKVYHAKHYDVHVSYEHDGLMLPYPNYPGDDEYPDALIPHLDGGAPPEEYPDTYTPMNLVVCVYLDSVAPGDGGTMVWPGSHEVVADYFPDDADAETFHEIQRDVWLPDLLDLGAPMEVVGSAGTAFLIHPALVHSIGPNLGDEVREMCLCRLARPGVEFNDIEPVVDLWGPFDGIDPSAT